MAKVIVTLRIMPDGVDTDLKNIEIKATEKITKAQGSVVKVEIEPVAFGLKALKLFFMMDESLGSTEKLETEISSIEGVQSVDAVDVRRAIG